MDRYWVWLTKELNITRLAVGIVAMFLESSFVEKFETESTRKMIWMKFFPHRTDTLTCIEEKTTVIFDNHSPPQQGPRTIAPPNRVLEP